MYRDFHEHLSSYIKEKPGNVDKHAHCRPQRLRSYLVKEGGGGRDRSSLGNGSSRTLQTFILCVCHVASVISDSFASLWTTGHQAPLSMGFSRQYWSGLPCPPPGDLSHSGIEPETLMSPALQAGSLPLAPPGKPQNNRGSCNTQFYPKWKDFNSLLF